MGLSSEEIFETPLGKNRKEKEENRTLPLKSKVKIAEVVESELKSFKNTTVLRSDEKDSTLTLHFVEELKA